MLHSATDASTLKPLLDELQSVATVIVETAASATAFANQPADFQSHAGRRSQNAGTKRGGGNDDVIDVEVA